MSEHELKLLGGKAKLWKILHPELTGHCRLCLHLLDFEWCRTNPRCVYDIDKNITMISAGVVVGHERRMEKIAAEKGILFYKTGHYVCIEWAKYV
jgi:hypothetical protein